ncbi:MAG: N-acyl homoserine lactonase family protein [Thermoleophilaceae bacterium]|nr:N-acyl homoserine lactonase family protein [Thermoleophilaceae bacterium]
MSEIATTTLSAPLSGGSSGANVSVRPLLTAELAAPSGFVHREPGFGAKLRLLRDGALGKNTTWLPAPVFLVEHPTAGLILIDTGMPAAAALNPVAALGRLGAKLYKSRMQPEQAVAAQLRGLGIAPTDIGTVVMTHLHYDHAGGVGEFPQAVFVTTTAEWEAAFAPRGVLHGYIKRQYSHAFDFRLINYNAQSVNSFASFGRSFDLFDDGSVTLVATPGHTAGHQSIVLRTGSGEVLLCGDAAYSMRTLNEGLLPLIMHDEHTFKRSVREIQAYIDMTPGTTVIPGHDVVTWPKLKPIYS